MRWGIARVRACDPSFLTEVVPIMTTPITIVRRFYDAIGRGDLPAVLSLLDAQVEWTEGLLKPE